ncbi:MAG: hypothetical protein IJG60_08095 [Thermoguttaceae bacterium]|nr:hypothetical protein [Thermoguttaceae bacterium]
MARFLAVDWDHSEVRYLYGTVSGDQLTLLKSGAAPVSDSDEGSASEKPAEEALSEGEPGEETAPAEAEEAPSGAGGDAGNLPGDLPEPKSARSPKAVSVKDPLSVRRGQVLKRLLRRDGVPSAPVILCIPRDRVELLNLSLPRLAESELPDVVKNQVLRDSTVYAEGYPLDFVPLAAEPKSNTGKIFSASISRAELRNLRTFCSAAGRRPAKIELRLTALAEFVLSGQIGADEPFLLVQEGADEVGFALFREGAPAYFRAVQVDSELAGDERQKRLAAEITRTCRIVAGEEPISTVFLFGEQEEYEPLIAELAEREIGAETVSPWTLPQVAARPEAIKDAARFAPLVGALLAERGKKPRPVLDLLHPRQKPKPPNFTLPLVLLLAVCAGGLAYLWYWNKKDLVRLNNETAALAKDLAALQGEYAQLQPQYSVLENTQNWERYGVTVLDELRDILLRLPPAPDLLISRMAYNGFDPMYNCPVFIISAKITEPQVYQRFYRNMTADNAFGINSRGAVQVPAVTGDETARSAEYNFQAVIFCKRRSAQDYLRKLPDDLRAVSPQKPEFYGQPVDGRESAGSRQPQAEGGEVNR